MDATKTPSSIEPGRLYLAREAKQHLRIGESGWKSLCEDGLRVIRYGRNSYVFGEDILRVFFEQREGKP